MRKTSLLRDRSDGPAVRQADMNYGHSAASCDAGCARVWSSAPTRDLHLARTLGAISSSRCQISRGGEEPISRSIAAKRITSWTNSNPLVEPDGIEPTTSCLQSRRSPN
jgi:hypothetical protein